MVAASWITLGVLTAIAFGGQRFFRWRDDRRVQRRFLEALGRV